MAEHTPGPWTASARNVYSKNLNVVIAQCWERAIFTDDILPVEANARLIAAAPALVEACELFVKAVENPRSDDLEDIVAAVETYLPGLKAALAAARPQEAE